MIAYLLESSLAWLKKCRLLFSNYCVFATVKNEFLSSAACFIAELQRAKRASEAPWVRKIGNPSSRENLVMASAYDRPSQRASENP